MQGADPEVNTEKGLGLSIRFLRGTLKAPKHIHT